MELIVQRYSDENGSTLGLLFINFKFECYTLEDRYRSDKIYGETRIPAGRYKIELKEQSRFDGRYKKKIKNYRGMLHILDVPNYKGILIHIGNTEEDTAGCLLVGNRANNNNCEKGMIYDSTSAFKSLYPKIANVIEQGEDVYIKFIDLDRIRINK